MKVLGIVLGHDTSACLIEDGKIVRFSQEERYNRLKSGVSTAINSAMFCLGDYQVKDMDCVAIGSGFTGMTLTHRNVMFRYKDMGVFPWCFDGKTGDANLVEVDHHLCHAASSYYTSGFEDALVVTIDGIGETTTHAIYEATGKELKPIHLIKTDGIYSRDKDDVFKVRPLDKKTFSLGWFYGMVTDALGWRMIVDEGKTMGLAPYGDPKSIPRKEMIAPMYQRYPESFLIDGGKFYYHFGGANEYRRMIDKYGRENLAACAQALLEDKVLALIGKWLKRTGKKRLCTAGGVFLNVKLNQKIVERFPDIEYWPFPLASDSGVSIGAAFVEYYKRCDTYKPHRLDHLYLGDSYTNEQIETVLKRNKLNYRHLNLSEIAKHLADNKIVGWFQGAMEAGPRALGNRSILMSPLRAENKDLINRDVKFRESFRPFCPSVTSEDADRYFDGGGEFMITACNVCYTEGDGRTEEGGCTYNPISAVTHVDGTARPQKVRKEINPGFHKLLSVFGKLTGHPVLLNTSLNVMGEPICRTPEEAIRCFYGNGLDHLVLGDFVISKGA